MFDKFRDECGVFGIFGHPEAANLAYLGLYALQHRGQESAGIAASDGTTSACVVARMGYVADIFNDDRAASCRGTGDRPRALLDGRREPPGERAAVPDRLRARPDRHLPQRQPRERRELRDELVRERLHLPDQQRHRGGAAPVRAVAGAVGRGGGDRVGRAGAAARSRS
jgi:hypothetical protein